MDLKNEAGLGEKFAAAGGCGGQISILRLLQGGGSVSASLGDLAFPPATAGQEAGFPAMKKARGWEKSESHCYRAVSMAGTRSAGGVVSCGEAGLETGGSGEAPGHGRGVVGKAEAAVGAEEDDATMAAETVEEVGDGFTGG
jgi:hypothetical protein